MQRIWHCAALHLKADCGLVLGRQTNSFIDHARIRTAHAAFTPEILSARALKRRPRFASKQAALQSFASKVPFKAFQSCALAAYIEHGLIELPGRSRNQSITGHSSHDLVKHP